MTSLFATLAELEKTGGSAALCTIIRSRGSVPRHVASKMLVYADGRIEGTVGGGELESRVIREAQAALQQGAPRLVSYTLSDLKAGDTGDFVFAPGQWRRVCRPVEENWYLCLDYELTLRSFA